MFLKKYIKQAFEFWGTVWQRVNDQNTVVLRNYSEQNSSIAPSLRNFGTTLKILKYSVHIKFQKRESVCTQNVTIKSNEIRVNTKLFEECIIIWIKHLEISHYITPKLCMLNLKEVWPSPLIGGLVHIDLKLKNAFLNF